MIVTASETRHTAMQTMAVARDTPNMLLWVSLCPAASVEISSLRALMSFAMAVADAFRSPFAQP